MSPSEPASGAGTGARSAFITLALEPHPEQYVEAALSGVHAAGRPYLDWFFGSPNAAREVLETWMRRSSSEVFIGRTVLLVVDNVILGGFIALGGAELARCRAADALAASRLGDPSDPGDRTATMDRIRRSGELFPPVSADEFYLSKFWVSPQARHAGRGAALLRRCQAVASEKGFDRLSLDVSSTNSAAVQLYCKFGFKQLEESTLDDANIRYFRMIAELS